MGENQRGCNHTSAAVVSCHGCSKHLLCLIGIDRIEFNVIGGYRGVNSTCKNQASFVMWPPRGSHFCKLFHADQRRKYNDHRRANNQDVVFLRANQFLQTPNHRRHQRFHFTSIPKCFSSKITNTSSFSETKVKQSH